MSLTLAPLTREKIVPAGTLLSYQGREVVAVADRTSKSCAICVSVKALGDCRTLPDCTSNATNPQGLIFVPIDQYILMRLKGEA